MSLEFEFADFFNPDQFLPLLKAYNRSAIRVIFFDHKMGICPQELSVQLPSVQVLGEIPPVYPEFLGGRRFLAAHGVRFPYVGGDMARGISSVEMVVAFAKQGILSFFGAAGLQIDKVEQAILSLKAQLDPLQKPFGINLIYQPQHPDSESALVTLFLKHGVKCVSASAYMTLSKNVVWFAAKGLSQGENGRIFRTNYVFAKISHMATARVFMLPPPKKMVEALLREGKITEQEAFLAAQIPVSEDITVEADSGGHTDNRPSFPLFSRIKLLRHQLMAHTPAVRHVRLGLAGGIGTPEAVAGAFAMGADYVLVGSVHQSCLESGLSTKAKAMMETVDIDGMGMAACADMFEKGVKVQVLRKGTMMANRANHLYELYKCYDSLEEIPCDVIKKLEDQIFLKPLAEVWAECEAYLMNHNPTDLDRAKQDKKYKMSRVFRWYISKSSKWPIQGDSGRQLDYQIWCGPAMGAFNTWVKGTFLEPVENRNVVQVCLNLLEGAALLTRIFHLRMMGFDIPSEAALYFPQKIDV